MRATKWNQTSSFYEFRSDDSRKRERKKASVAGRRYAFDFSIESRDRIDAVRRGITMVSHGRTSLPATQKTTPLHPSNSSSSRSSWLFPTSFLHFPLSPSSTQIYSCFALFPEFSFFSFLFRHCEREYPASAKIFSNSISSLHYT